MFKVKTDPEMGCKAPDSDASRGTPANEETFFDFLTTPQYLAYSTTESCGWRDLSSSLAVPSKCVVRSSIAEQRRSQLSLGS